MSRSEVTFVLGTDQIGQAATGNDFISGICLYGTAPGSFATTAQQAVYSVSDAEAKGITLDYADETLARGIVTIVRGSTGDTVKIVVTEPNPVTTANPTGTTARTLCEYTQAAGDTTDTLLAVSVVAAINANSYLTATGTLTGYTATNSAGVITLIARQGIGIGLNSGTPIATTVTGTLTATITQQFGTGSGGATAGVYSKKSVWHYEVSEFFRGNATGVLWVGFTATPSATYAEVVTLQNAANGACKQIAVFDPTVTSAATFTSNGTILQARAVDMFAAYNPCIILYAANIKAISDLSTLQNQQTKSNYYVSNVIMQDGAAAGAQLYINSGISITNVGCALGTTSKAKVNQDIGEIGAFNITDDTEMAVPAFANGQLVSAVASSLLNQLDSYRYLFATNQPNISGTFIVNDWSNINATSPYYRISRNRTMNKAVRLIYANIVLLLKSQIQLNPDGTITQVSIAKFGGAIIPVQTQMRNADELSNLRITINPAQNIISEGKIVIGVAIQPTITADFIQVNMSFVAKI